MIQAENITALVDQAIALDREIAIKDKELKGIKNQLYLLSLDDGYEKTKTEGGGWSAILTGSNGMIARVTKPGDKLKDKVDGETKDGKNILKLIGEEKSELFDRKVVYAPVASFRLRVIAKFTEAVAKRIIKACTTKSEVRVSFETKEEAKA